MRKFVKKAVCIFFVLILLLSLFPVAVFAVDPVSSVAIANAFAQAITAYGAANGVSMGFDTVNTSNIGESVHELWQAFRSGQQTADDYDALAAALFPDLYYKAEVALAGAATAHVVGVHIASEYAEVFDQFYDWLLSGPAELTKVDNQYFQFSNVDISVFSGDVMSLKYVASPGSNQATFNSSSIFRSFNWNTANNPQYAYSGFISPTGGNVAAILYYSSAGIIGVKFVALASGQSAKQIDYRHNHSTPYVLYNDSYSCNVSHSTSEGATYYTSSSGITFAPSTYTPYGKIFSSFQDGVDAYLGGYGLTAIDVGAYDSSRVASFPDVDDPNYDAIHRAKDIPLDIPWDDTLYGDGTGTLTDAQSGAITGTIDDILVAAGELDLVGEGTADPTPPDPDDDPSDDPGAYAVLGLDDVFPFCIPFDIYNFLSAMAATPTPPHFTATLQLPEAVGGAQTIDLDFDNPTFNQLAQLLRLLELLAFIVGLALLTRSMFIRG